MPKQEFTQIERQLAILRRIPVFPKKVSINDLMNYFEVSLNLENVSRRSVQRDMVELERIFGLSVETKGKENFYFFQEDTAPSLKMMGPDMALGFLLMEKYTGTLLPEQTLDRLSPYFREAHKVLRNEKFKYTDWDSRVALYPRVYPLIPASINANLLLDIYKSLLQCVKCEMTYVKKSGEVKNYTISTQGVIHREQVSYLLATYDNQKIDTPQTFAIHRIRSFELLSDKSIQIPGFSIDDYSENGQLGVSFCEDNQLELIFDKRAAQHLLETPLSTDQEITSVDENRVRVKATVNIKESVKWWLLGFGEQVEVIKPKLLRQEMTRIAVAMADRYNLNNK